jgi:acyl-CoA oxidase
MPLLAKTYALHFAQAELLESFHERQTSGEPPEREQRRLESLAAGLKATSSWHATETIQTARECCGGAGYLSVNRFAALKADTDVFTTFEGDNTVLMMLVARGLLTDFRDHFGELNPRELVMYVAEQAVETVVERLFARKIAQVIADVVPGRDETGDLLERESQLELFRWREGHITASVAQRFKRGLDEGFDPFEVFRAVQNHAVAAARAHIERVVLEAFARAVDACEEGPVKDALGRLCDLHALHQIELDRGYLQEHGRLTGARCKAVTREVNRLCDEVRGDGGALVDAFGIPDPVLRAPIGLRDPA